MKHYFTFFSLVFLFSCSNEPDNIEVAEKQDDPEEILVDSSEFIESETVSNNIPEGWIQIKFDRLTIQMENADFSWNGEGYESENSYLTNDTARIDLEPGDWMFDKKIKILDSEFDEIQLYTKDVVEVGVDSERMIEVPFCVMGNWKNSVSDWIEITGEDGLFIFDSQIEYISDTITYELTEFMDALKQNCGEEWHEEMLNYTRVDSLPTSEFVSEYHYKIIAKNSETGASIEKILIFYTPTSC